MNNEYCEDCIYFHEPGLPNYGNGICRRYPPKNQARLRESDKFTQPDTCRKNWCGEYKRKEI